MPDFGEQLELARSMTSAELRETPDWIAALCVLRERKRKNREGEKFVGECVWEKIKPQLLARRKQDEARDWILGR